MQWIFKNKKYLKIPVGFSDHSKLQGKLCTKRACRHNLPYRRDWRGKRLILGTRAYQNRFQIMGEQKLCLNGHPFPPIRFFEY